MRDARERLIVALDVSSAAAAHKIVAAVGDSARYYKVGLQLYTAEGPQIVRDLVASGRQVFLDLKLHDIPNTVASAVKEERSRQSFDSPSPPPARRLRAPHTTEGKEPQEASMNDGALFLLSGKFNQAQARA